MPRGVPRYSAHSVEAAKLAMMKALGDQFGGLPLDQIDAVRMRKAVRAGIEAYEQAVSEEVRANWDVRVNRLK
jgi:hypothetical protein